MATARQTLPPDPANRLPPIPFPNRNRDSNGAAPDADREAFRVDELTAEAEARDRQEMERVHAAWKARNGDPSEGNFATAFERAHRDRYVFRPDRGEWWEWTGTRHGRWGRWQRADGLLGAMGEIIRGFTKTPMHLAKFDRAAVRSSALRLAAERNAGVESRDRRGGEVGRRPRDPCDPGKQDRLTPGG